MAIQAMALGVNNPEINAVSALAAGQQARQSFDMNNIQIAKAGLETIGSIALGAMGGKIDGQADPALFNEGLDYLAQQGVSVDQFRDRPDLAPVIARSSMTALQQIQTAQDEKSYQLALDNFELEVMKAAQAAAPKPGAVPLTDPAERARWGIPESDTRPYVIEPGKPPALIDGTPNPPSGVAEYNFYAEQERAAGREPKSYEAYQASLKGKGLSVTTPDGTVVQMGGNMTEGQSKDTVYVTRANGALPIIDQFGTALTNPVERAVEGDQTGILRGMQTPEFQQAQQAGKEFLQAILRKDTGAAITAEEDAEYGVVYLPRPGDGPEVLEQKRVSRQRAVAAIEAGLPPQAILASEQALLKSSPTAATVPGAAPAAIGEGTIIENDAGERMIMQNGQWVKQ